MPNELWTKKESEYKQNTIGQITYLSDPTGRIVGFVRSVWTVGSILDEPLWEAVVDPVIEPYKQSGKVLGTYILFTAALDAVVKKLEERNKE